MKTVLIVDDSLTALMMGQMVLGSQGYEIITARDGVEAVDKAVAHRPDLILMDVEMPRLNGYDACKQVRAILGRRLPILLLTTRGSAQHVRQGFESGCTGYLTKPVDKEDLLSRVRNYLGD